MRARLWADRPRRLAGGNNSLDLRRSWVRVRAREPRYAVEQQLRCRELCVVFGKANLSVDDLRSRLDQRFRRPLMSYFLRRVPTREEAEDLTQEVFVRLLRASERGPIKDAEALVFVTAANLLRSHVSNAKRRPSGALDVDAEILATLTRDLIEDRNPERVLLGKETAGALLAALDELGERTRDIYVLFRLEGMKHREIAERFGVSVSLVEKEVMKASVHLARRFGRRP